MLDPVPTPTKRRKIGAGPKEQTRDDAQTIASRHPGNPIDSGRGCVRYKNTQSRQNGENCDIMRGKAGKEKQQWNHHEYQGSELDNPIARRLQRLRWGWCKKRRGLLRALLLHDHHQRLARIWVAGHRTSRDSLNNRYSLSISIVRSGPLIVPSSILRVRAKAFAISYRPGCNRGPFPYLQIHPSVTISFYLHSRYTKIGRPYKKHERPNRNRALPPRVSWCSASWAYVRTCRGTAFSARSETHRLVPFKITVSMAPLD